jgi:hypothetical protein
MLQRPDLLLVFPRSIGSLFQQPILRKKPKNNGISGHFLLLFSSVFYRLLIDSPNSCPLKRLPARKRPNFLLLFSRRNTGAGVTGT